MRIHKTGFVGIGIQQQVELLHVSGGNAFFSDSVGIGTTTLTAPLTVAGG